MDTLEYLTKEVQKFWEDRDWGSVSRAGRSTISGCQPSPMSLICSGSNQRNNGGDDRYSTERISEELADVFFFLLRFSQMYEFDFERSSPC